MKTDNLMPSITELFSSQSMKFNRNLLFRNHAITENPLKVSAQVEKKNCIEHTCEDVLSTGNLSANLIYLLCANETFQTVILLKMIRNQEFNQRIMCGTLKSKYFIKR